MNPAVLTAGAHSSLPRMPHSDVTAQRQEYKLGGEGVAVQMPWPLKRPWPFTTSSQQGVEGSQSDEILQSLLQAEVPVVSVMHSESESQQMSLQARVTGQQALSTQSSWPPSAPGPGQHTVPHDWLDGQQAPSMHASPEEQQVVPQESGPGQQALSMQESPAAQHSPPQSATAHMAPLVPFPPPLVPVLFEVPPPPQAVVAITNPSQISRFTCPPESVPPTLDPIGFTPQALT